jgi:DNA-binding NarL/FixJ family response regulator
MKRDINILLVGNHPVFMECVASRLRVDPRFFIVGPACTPAQVVDFVNSESAIHLVLLDADAVADSHTVFTNCIKTFQPESRIICLSALADDAAAEVALETGANGLVLKSDLSNTIMSAVYEVLGGGSWFPESVRSRIVIDSRGVRLEGPAHDAADGLATDLSKPPAPHPLPRLK